MAGNAKPDDAANRPGPHRRASDRIWCKNNWSVVERAVAEAIARHLNDQGIAWPGQKRIALIAGVNPRSVRNAVKVLIDGDPSRGLLPLYTRTRRRGESGKPMSDQYQLVERPERLVEARGKHEVRAKEIEAILAGRTHDTRHVVDDKTADEARDLRRRELLLQAAYTNEQIPEPEYLVKVASLAKERELLARRSAAGSRWARP